MARYNNDPRIITARFDSTCPETGRTIKRGDKIAYYPRNRTAYHIESKSADSVRGLEFSEAYGMADANW